jgi:hypothetical protein
MKAYLLFIIIISNLAVYSQEKDSTVKLDGNIGLFYDTYSYDVSNYNSFRPRNPSELLRFNFNATIAIGKYFSIPFGINISNQKTSYNLPNLPEENLFSYVQNPRNNIHIDPKYKWFQLHLGSHTPNYSQLTTGDIQIFGIGFEMNPGKFILGANYGKSQIGFEPDALLNVAGAYDQKIYGMRLGYGKIEGSKFVLNFVKIEDDIFSVVNKPIGINPIAGITISPLLEFKITEKFTVKTETAGSVFTSNLNATPIVFTESYFNSINNIVSLNSSSKADFSHATSLQFKSNKFSLGGEIKYIGPGFIPVGYRNMEKDIIDYKINAGLKFLKNKVDIKGAFGVRTNNIKNTKLQSTERIISNVNVFAQITKSFSINANYNNFSFGNNETNSLIRIEMINNSFSLAPSYQINAKTINHQISANLSMNSFQQFDVISNGFTNTNSNSYNLNYMLIFKNNPANIGISGLLLENKSPITDLNIINFNTNLGYKFYQKKMIPSMNIGYSIIRKDNFTPDTRINLKFKFLYKINKKLDFNLAYSLNNNQYGSYRPDGVLTENILQLSLLKKL